MTNLISRFDLVVAELRTLGLTLRRLPGEYCVNFRYGSDKTARMAEDLDQALELGRAMAAERATDQATTTRPLRRKWRRRRITAKAQRRLFIRRHNRRLRSRARRLQKKNSKS